MPHPLWGKIEVETVSMDSKPKMTIGDHFAYYFIQSLRTGFDYMSGYSKILPFQK